MKLWQIEIEILLEAQVKRIIFICNIYVFRWICFLWIFRLKLNIFEILFWDQYWGLTKLENDPWIILISQDDDFQKLLEYCKRMQIKFLISARECASKLKKILEYFVHWKQLFNSDQLRQQLLASGVFRMNAPQLIFQKRKTLLRRIWDSFLNSILPTVWTTNENSAKKLNEGKKKQKKKESKKKVKEKVKEQK